MRFTPLAAVAVALAPQVSTGTAADVCSLLSQADAATLLAQPVAPGRPAGPEPDEDSGGQSSYCTYRAASAAVIVSVVEFSSSAEAQKQLTKNLVQERMDAEDAKVIEEPGLGEKSYYSASANGAMFIFLKKNKVVGIAIGGDKLGKAATLKAALRVAAQTAASKV